MHSYGMQAGEIPPHFIDPSYADDNSILKYSEHTSFFHGLLSSPPEIFYLFSLKPADTPKEVTIYHDKFYV